MQIQNQAASEAKVRAIEWTGRSLTLLDQRRLPAEEVYLDCQDACSVATAIRDMAVQGPTAVGIAAAYGIALAARQIGVCEDWEQALAADFRMLEAARPSAMHLVWTLRVLRERLQRLAGHEDVPGELLQAARAIHDSDVESNLTMGRLGAQLIRRHQKGPQNLMTHSNAGALGTGGYGTALGVIRSAHRAGLVDTIYVAETRPRLQGARLTAWELAHEGIPALLSVDSAAAHLMKTLNIGWIVVGADRIAANGDLIGEIGTYALAILAMHHGLRFMVVAPSSTIDLSLEFGEDAPLEERDQDELLDVGGRSLDAGVPVLNPMLDVTPADLIDVIVTEKGVIERPDAAKLAELLSHRRLH